MGVRRTHRALRAATAAVAIAALAGTLLVAPSSASVRSDVTPSPVPTPVQVTPTPPPLLPAIYVRVVLSPANGATVGVATPIVAKFSLPVARKARAERNMKVYVGAALAVGAWHWKDSSTAVFRLKDFWPGHSRVYVRMTLAGVELATSKGYRYVAKGTGTRVHVLRIARSMVSYVDAKTLRMRVLVDGRLVRVFKISLGKAGYETRSGIKAVMEKYLTRRMTSQLAGITDPNDQYDLVAPFAVRLTPTGEFAHGAPWAAGRIGVRNGSHGCTNLFTADATWFYSRVLPGDPVITTGTARVMEPWNGPGAAYNMAWKTWLTKSATKGVW